MGRRYDIQWSSIEIDYRLLPLSIRALARKHGVAPSSISRRAKRRRWRRRDLIKYVNRLAYARADRDTAREQRIWQEYNAYLELARCREERPE